MADNYIILTINKQLPEDFATNFMMNPQVIAYAPIKEKNTIAVMKGKDFEGLVSKLKEGMIKVGATFVEKRTFDDWKAMKSYLHSEYPELYKREDN